MTKIVKNLNSHPIKVERPNGSIWEYPPDGRLFRLQMEDRILDEIDGNQIIKRVYYLPEEDIIPPPEPDVYYIVPSQICQILDRDDLISPDTKQANGAKRDRSGQVLSVQRFRACDGLERKKR